MTSSRKKHHPPGAVATPPPPAPTRRPKSDPATVKQWVIRVVAVLGVGLGVAMALIGAEPGIAGGWGKLALMVPGMIIAAGSFAAFIETTPWARSKRPRR